MKSFVIRNKFSKDIIKSLKISKERDIQEGCVYCINYIGNDLPTDKWHNISIFLVTEKTADEIRGFNFLYFNAQLIKNILRFANKNTFSSLKSIIENELFVMPYTYAYKALKKERIHKILKIDKSEWDMLPNIDKTPFGNLSVNNLIADWNRENLIVYKKNKKDKPVTQSKEEEPFTESLTATDLDLFEKDMSTSLRDIDFDTFDDDEDI